MNAFTLICIAIFGPILVVHAWLAASKATVIGFRSRSFPVRLLAMLGAPLSVLLPVFLLVMGHLYLLRESSVTSDLSWTLALVFPLESLVLFGVTVLSRSKQIGPERKIGSAEYAEALQRVSCNPLVGLDRGVLLSALQTCGLVLVVYLLSRMLFGLLVGAGRMVADLGMLAVPDSVSFASKIIAFFVSVYIAFLLVRKTAECCSFRASSAGRSRTRKLDKHE